MTQVLRPRPDLTDVAAWKVNQHMDDLCLSTVFDAWQKPSKNPGPHGVPHQH